MTKQIKTDIVIIGAGISGLASANFLKKEGFDFIILEKESRAGGAIQTEYNNGFLIEYGPNSTLDTSPIIHELFSDAGIESEMEYANDKSNNRYIMKNGQLNALPMSPIAFLKTPHFSWKTKLGLLKEPFIKPAPSEVEETLAEFVKRRLGQEFLDYAIDPFVAGVYAGVPEHLSVKSGFPKLFALEEKYGSLIKGAILGARERKKQAEISKQSAKLFSFPKGMQTVVNALEKIFSENLFLKTRINSIVKKNGEFLIETLLGEEQVSINSKSVLLNIPLDGYSEIPTDIIKPIQASLEKIYHPAVTMVYFGYFNNPANRPLDGFGFLIPRKEERKILGTIWSSTIFTNRAPAGGTALTTFVGGSRQPEIALLPEAELIETVKNELREILGIEKKPDLVITKAWPKAIPQYDIGHQQFLDEIIKLEKENLGLYLSGNFRGGISVGDCIKQAKSMAEKIKKEIQIN